MAEKCVICLNTGKVEEVIFPGPSSDEINKGLKTLLKLIDSDSDKHKDKEVSCLGVNLTCPNCSEVLLGLITLYDLLQRTKLTINNKLEWVKDQVLQSSSLLQEQNDNRSPSSGATVRQRLLQFATGRLVTSNSGASGEGNIPRDEFINHQISRTKEVEFSIKDEPQDMDFSDDNNHEFDYVVADEELILPDLMPDFKSSPTRRLNQRRKATIGQHENSSAFLSDHFQRRTVVPATYEIEIKKSGGFEEYVEAIIINNEIKMGQLYTPTLHFPKSKRSRIENEQLKKFDLDKLTEPIVMLENFVDLIPTTAREFFDPIKNCIFAVREVKHTQCSYAEKAVKLMPQEQMTNSKTSRHPTKRDSKKPKWFEHYSATEDCNQRKLPKNIKITGRTGSRARQKSKVKNLKRFQDPVCQGAEVNDADSKSIEEQNFVDIKHEVEEDEDQLEKDDKNDEDFSPILDHNGDDDDSDNFDADKSDSDDSYVAPTPKRSRRSLKTSRSSKSKTLTASSDTTENILEEVSRRTKYNQSILIIDGKKFHQGNEIREEGNEMFCYITDCEFKVLKEDNEDDPGFCTKLLLHLYTIHFPETKKQTVPAKTTKSEKTRVRGSATWTCDMCPSLPKMTLTNFRKHMGRAHREIKDPTIKYVECICGKPFNRSSSVFLKRHIWSHCNEEEIAQKLAAGEIDPRPAAAKYLLYRSDVPRFKCSDCGKQFKMKRSLLNHMNIHKDETEQQKWICEYCARVFIQSCSLRMHMKLIHNPDSVNWKICPVCDKKFALLAKLKYHMMSQHGKAKEIQCEQCGMGFVEKRDLERHLISHLGPDYRPLKCEFCPETYRHIANLRRHISNVHKDKRRPLKYEPNNLTQPIYHTCKQMYPCLVEHCTKLFELPSRRKKHLLTAHGLDANGEVVDTSDSVQKRKSRKSTRTPRKKTYANMEESSDEPDEIIEEFVGDLESSDDDNDTSSDTRTNVQLPYVPNGAVPQPNNVYPYFNFH